MKEEKPVRGELLTVTEAANRYRLKKDVFYRLINNMEIAVFAVPYSQKKIDSADIDDLLLKYKISAITPGTK